MVLSLLSYVECLCLELLSNSFVHSFVDRCKKSSTLTLQPLDLLKPLDIERGDSEEEEDEEEEEKIILPSIVEARLNRLTKNLPPTLQRWS